MRKSLKLLFLLLFIIFPLGQLTRLPLNIASVNIYFHDLIIVLIFLVWFGDHLLHRRKFVLPPLFKPILGFIAIAWLSFIFNIFKYSISESIISVCYLLRWIAFSGIYFIVWEFKDDKKFFQKGLLLTGVMTAILGLLQYIFWPDTRFLYYSGWDRHFYRVIGLFLDPGFIGMIYVLGLILLAAVFWKKLSKKTPLFYILYSIFYLALALTYSRSAYLAYLTGMGVIAWRKKTFKLFIFISALLVLTVLLLPRPAGEGVKLERKASAIARVGNWQSSLEIIKNHPFLGIGFNFYRYAQRNYGFLRKDWRFSHAGAGADNSLLFVGATTGIIGLIVYFWLWYSLIVKHGSLVILASSSALLMGSFFNNSLFYPWIMLWLWILVGTTERR